MALSIYGLKRQKKIAEWEARLKLLHEKYPRLQEIDTLFSQFALELALLEMGKGKLGMGREELAKAQEALAWEKKKLLKEYNLPDNIYEIWWDCPACQDTGYIEVGKKCQCLIKEEAGRRWQVSGLSPVQANQTFANFSLEWYEDKEHYKAILEKALNFAEKISCRQQAGNLLLYGAVGTGKSHLCSAIANYALQAGVGVVYMKVGKLLDLLREHKFKLEKNDLYTGQGLESLYRVELLILDDLGTENLTDFAREQLLLLLDERLNHNLSWVISTNLSPNDIGAIYEDRISDRIMGTAEALKFTGESIRIRKMVKQKNMFRD